MRIIHLEDDDVIVEFVQILCARHEYVWVKSSEQASRVASERHFDLALVDLGLPNGDSGLHFLSWLVEHAPNTYRVLVSGVTTRDTASVARRAHASLDKPFTPSQFAALLEQAAAAVSSVPATGSTPDRSTDAVLRRGLVG